MEHKLSVVQGSLAANNIVYVQWLLGNFCNYSCSYCPSLYHDGSKPYVELSKAIKVLDWLNSIGRRIYLCFSGGEPTVHPQFFDLMNYIRMNCPLVEPTLVSNGSRNFSFYEKLLPLLKWPVTLTYHVERARYDDYAKVCEILGNKLGKIHLPMVPDLWDHCVEAYTHLSIQRKFVVVPKVLFKDFDSLEDGSNRQYDYTQDQLDWIKLHAPPENKHLSVLDDAKWEKMSPQQLITNQTNHFKGWYCRAGIDMLTIGFTGNVYKGACAQDGILGNVYDADSLSAIQLPTSKEHTVCTKEVCWCVTDIAATKWKPITLNP